MILLDIYREFRTAIEVACDERGFSIKDRMHRFHGGCCDDTCDLFAYYLNEEYGIHTRQLVKIYEPDEPEIRCNHVVLLLDDDNIIDLTGDQFPGGPKVYYGKEDDFYQAMEFDRIQDNYNIEQDRRLWDEYQVILCKLGH